MDVLSEILDKVELTSSYWYRTSFAGDWGISLPQEENLARFHIVTHGEFWYEVPKLKLKALAEQGDILIFFRDGAHHGQCTKNQGRACGRLELKPTSPKLKFWNTVIRASSKPTSFADIFVLMADLIIHFGLPNVVYQERLITPTRLGLPCFYYRAGSKIRASWKQHVSQKADRNYLRKRQENQIKKCLILQTDRKSATQQNLGSYSS
jgi:hypothetical protein